MITTSALIDKFQQALTEKWGYIWGTAGVKWTKAKQEALEKTTDSDRAQGRKYGAKWIGHTVADCSGLFSWAFKQLGGYMYHGSNTMYDKYCTDKGNLKAGKRTDGKTLEPGTAVFVYNESKKKRTHVGLYVGNGKVIEAASTIKGVVTSAVTDNKWNNWGELKGVDYSGKPEPGPAPGYAIVTGTKVALRQDPSVKSAVILRVNTGETVKLEPEPDEWDFVSYGGKKGWMMKKFLKEG